MEKKDLFQLIDRYNELLDEKDRLKKETEENDGLIADIKEAITNEMIENDTPSISHGLYTYSLQNKTKYSKKGDDTLQAEGVDYFQTLREEGLGGLIKLTVNAQSLQSAVAEAVRENGGNLSEGLASIVSVYEYTDVSRKKTPTKGTARKKK